MNKIYVEKKSYTNSNGEAKEYKDYYIYVDNKYNIPNLKVNISIEHDVLDVLESLGVLHEEEKK